jgi:hypothetical protein
MKLSDSQSLDFPLRTKSFLGTSITHSDILPVQQRRVTRMPSLPDQWKPGSNSSTNAKVASVTDIIVSSVRRCDLRSTY